MHHSPLDSSSTVKHLTRIYCIYNTQNNRKYIGKACQSIGERLKGHLNLLARENHYSKLMQSDFREQGEQVFHYEVLEVIPRRRRAENVVFDVMEHFWIDTLNPEYNTRKYGILRCRFKEQLRCIRREQQTLLEDINELSQKLLTYQEKFTANNQQIEFLSSWLDKRQELMRP